jgi:uncharacterized membrane protein YdjX (TVP38/TMEM64 family)
MSAQSPRKGLAPSGYKSVALALVVALIGLAAATWWVYAPELSVAQLAENIRDWGTWGVGGSIVLMVLHSFVPFPAELLACANGVVYGPVWGTVVTWTGAMLGAWAGFALARAFGRPFVERVVAARHKETLDAWTETNGWRVALISRFIPVIAFNLINYAGGLSRLSLWDFTWTTAIGILPGTFVMVLAGDQAEHIGWPLWLGFAAAVIALCYAISRRRSWKQ